MYINFGIISIFLLKIRLLTRINSDKENIKIFRINLVERKYTNRQKGLLDKEGHGARDKLDAVGHIGAVVHQHFDNGAQNERRVHGHMLLIPMLNVPLSHDLVAGLGLHASSMIMLVIVLVLVLGHGRHHGRARRGRGAAADGNLTLVPVEAGVDLEEERDGDENDLEVALDGRALESIARHAYAGHRHRGVVAELLAFLERRLELHVRVADGRDEAPPDAEHDEERAWYQVTALNFYIFTL
jgi:hypothetical protein